MAVFIVAIAVNIIMFNVLMNKATLRVDLTKDKVFTLSRATVKMLEGLEDDVLIKVYITKDLPVQFSKLERFLRDKLEDYSSYSKGRLRYTIIHPEDDEAYKKEAQKLGLVAGNVQERKKDKLSVRKAYMGMVMLFADRKEIIPWIPGNFRHLTPVMEFMEYDLTRRIKNLVRTKGQKHKIGLLAGHKEATTSRGLSRLAMMMKQFDYQLKPVTLTGGKTVPADLDTLLVIGPKTKLTESEKFEIDQFLMKGKTVAFFLDNLMVGRQPRMPKNMIMGRPHDEGLRDMLKHYGVEFKKGIVLDDSCFPVPIPRIQRMGNIQFRSRVMKPYAPWIRVINMGKSLLTRSIPGKGLGFPFTAELSITKQAREKLKVLELAKSSSESWKMDGPFYFLNLETNFQSPWQRELTQAVSRVERAAQEVRALRRKAQLGYTVSGSDLNTAIDKYKKAKAALSTADDKAKLEKRRKAGPYLLAAALSGNFTSFWAGKKAPRAAKKDSGKSPKASAKEKKKGPKTEDIPVLAKTRKKTHILVIGNSHFIMDNMMAPGNQVLIQNLIDWLVQDEEMISIRSRTLAAAPLDPNMSQSKKNLARILNIAGIPLLLVLFGLGRWLYRKRKREIVIG